jgi:RNA polymerase sigma-70 factor (ECF subfamily)
MDTGPEPSADVSRALVERIQAGDRQAFEELYLRYHDPLLFTIRSRLGPTLRSRLQSEDILQSVVMDALGDLDRFEARGPGSLGHYLHVCVLNKIRNKAEFFSAQKRAGALPLSESLADRLPASLESGPRYIDTERYAKLERAIAQLPENMREVVLLRSVEGLSNREAAEIVGKSPEAVSKIHNRAVARLGLALGTPHGPGEEHE